MKLRYASASPFVRKVSITLLETGLDDRVERIPTSVWDPATDIGVDNPLGKVPALTTDGGEILFDSSVICEYLDSLHDGQKLFPASGGARWNALRLQSLGDGMGETGIRRILEQRQGGDAPRQAWIDRQNMVLERCFKVLEDDLDQLAGPITIGPIAIASAIGWLDFRFSDLDWKDRFPGVADWYAGFCARPSLVATEPTE